jgi:monoamine oxidase
VRESFEAGILAASAQWPSDPNALGSYTCNQPGYFTTREGWLGEPAGNLAFAGEHTDTFHDFQGFMCARPAPGRRYGMSEVIWRSFTGAIQ